MKKIVAMGGSNSKRSINKTLAGYAANHVLNSETVIADLNDYNLPIYGTDYEAEYGIPENAKKLNSLLASADGLVLSLAEHNGSYSAAFKNAYDWMSRIDQKVWKNKPMLLMATSGGARGGASVLEAARKGFPYLGANIVADFSLPSFHENYSEEGIRDNELNNQLNHEIEKFQKII
jgi:chromate reductase